MPTDEQRALWAAIRSNPDDDAPRLVYADWLQEHGDETRAEFIRVQCELAQIGLDRRKGRKRLPVLEPREKALLAAHRYEWGAEFHRVMNTPPSDPPPANWHPISFSLANYNYRRGFLNGNLSLSQINAFAGADDTLEPFEVRGTFADQSNYTDQHLQTVLQWTGAAGLYTIDFYGVGDDAIRILTTTDHHLLRLNGLHLSGGANSDDAVRELALWPWSAKLRTLHLSDSPFTDASARWLAESPHLNRLGYLEVWKTQITENGRHILRERFGSRVSIF